MTRSKYRTAIQSPSFWLVVFLLTSFILGINRFQDFGVSFDEPGIYNFAPVVVDMYSTAFNPPEKPVFQRETFLHRRQIPTDLFNYGPFYFVAAELFVRSLQTLGIQTPYWDLWHLAYFITFEASLVVFYLLCRRWLSGWASLAATILFATQPLIIGHVFMNPKDTPFMIFFMASVWSGLLMVDKLRLEPTTPTRKTNGDFFSSLHTEWQTVHPESKAKARRGLIVLGIVFLILLLITPLLDSLAQKSITAIYSAPPASLAGSLLRSLSNDPQNIPLDDFITKGQTWLRRFELLAILLILGRAIWIGYTLVPGSGRQAAQTVSSRLRALFKSLINPYVLLAGILLGLTFSIRMFAPLAGALVLAYLLWKRRWQGILPAGAYGLVAIITSYITWPYLWGEPVNRLLKSWAVMNDFSAPGSWWSLPTLLSIQYTEPAVLLTVAGFVIAIVEFIRGKRSGLLFVFLGWSLLPMIVLMARHASLYNNFRQVLFIIPPFFIIAGLAIEKIIQYFHRPVMTGALILLIILPGILADVRLHPYEYVYYNQFIGGVSHAAQRYDADYWAVSAKETAEYLNHAAPENATILTCGPVNTLKLYLRPDLQMTACEAEQGTPENKYDYLIVSGRGYINTEYYPGAEVVFSVNRDHTVLAMVKSLKVNAN